MTTVYDVPPKELIDSVTEKLKGYDTITPPEWSRYVKTGTHKEKAPDQNDWWFIRASSILRKVYVMGPIGVERLAAEYGGPKDRGAKPNKAVKGSRAIVRNLLKQLQEAGLVEAKRGRGRVISSSGQALLDNSAREVITVLAKENKALKKYL